MRSPDIPRELLHGGLIEVWSPLLGRELSHFISRNDKRRAIVIDVGVPAFAFFFTA